MKSKTRIADFVAAMVGHVHAAADTSSGVFALARLIASSTAGAPLRINAAGNALSSAFPLVAVRDTAVSVTTTPTALLTLALPEAGKYLLELSANLGVATVTGTRTITCQIDATNFTSMAVSCMKNTTAALSAADAVTTNGSSHTIGLSSNQRGQFWLLGPITVSNSSTLTLTFSIAGDTAELKAGSFVRATRLV